MEKPLQILLYVARNGKIPFQTWIENLQDKKGRYLIKTRVDRIEEGNFGDCKFLGEGVFELRINFGPGYRVYFGRDGDRVVLLLCGGHKGSQQKDITKARKYWKDYEERKDG